MTALSVTNLCKQFGGLRVTANVNLAVAPGERRLIIGPNGAGKTTLFNLITGEIAPDSGSIRLFEKDITRVSVHRRPHLGMARTYQIITLFASDTILRNVTLALIEHNMDVALDWAERITLLHFGEVIVEGTRAEVVANPRTREVYLGH